MKSVIQIGLIFTLALTIAIVCGAQDSTRHVYYPKRRRAPLPMMPSFPGGTDSLASFIKRNAHYPVTASKKGIKGDIEVDFALSKQGLITNPHVSSPIGYGCDEEAIRVVKLMPRWMPYVKARQPRDTTWHVVIPFGTNTKTENNK